MIYIINSPVLTNYGFFEYKPNSVTEIKQLLQTNEYISAVGHEETATMLTRLFGINVPFNRLEVHQEVGDTFVVIKPKKRLEINRDYSEKDIEKIGFELGILIRKR